MTRARLSYSAAAAALLLTALAVPALAQAPTPAQGTRPAAGGAPPIQQPVRAPAAPGAAQAPAAQAPAAEAASQESAPPPRRRVGGYLGADRVPDDLVFLPPPPAVGSPLGIADVAIFKATRALENGPRWALATSDNNIDRKSLLGDFSCALGLDLATLEPPAITRLIARSSADLFGVIGKAKDRYQRPRPFVTEEGPVCIVPSEAFAKSGSYPSGHSATGWLYALLLAEIDPDNADAIMARGRAYGESRVVCGVHYESDIEYGRVTAATLVAALHGTAEFQVDVVAARTELAELKIAPQPKPDAAACAAERAQLAKPY
ncbi:MAG TPA: phosphatase PAP2 family protein [Gammaproteobacteria bacterium]|nr:phosphatase PAP2 family protein [Gammaproteobacteria bacterium]